MFLKQLEYLLKDETDSIANMSNASAFLNEILDDINWVGFYRIVNNELLLGPFQGKVACVHIPIGKGVCGSAAFLNKTMHINNVHEFEGHIACDSASNSEVVVPLYKDNKCIGVLDIDSPSLNRFTNEDVLFIEKCASIIEKYI